MRARSLSAVLAAALAIGAAAVLIPSLGRAGDDGHHHGFSHSWWGPPRDVRAMLAQVSAHNLRNDDLKLVSFGTRHTLSSQTDPNRGIGAARDWIKSQFDLIAATSGGRMSTELLSYVQPGDPRSRIPVDTTITDVVATLHGTDTAPDHPVYVVSGHYDSRVTNVLNATDDAPGANDDASGVSALLEMARVMASHPTEGTIVFAAVAGEEQGLYGSEHLAQVAQDDHWNVLGDFNMDIVGSSLGGNGVRDRHDIRLFSDGVPTNASDNDITRLQTIGGENDSGSRQLARYVKEVGENDATDMNIALRWRRDRYLRSGDHVPFLERGYSAVRFTEPNENYDHEHQDVRVENGVQFGDLPQFVDFDFLARVTRVLASTLEAIARSPRAPLNARALSTNLTYNADLRWSADPEPDLAGYEVVWRDTLDPLWTHSKWVGNVTSYTLVGVNKDDFQVGVRAVDRDGNKSPVAFAR